MSLFVSREKDKEPPLFIYTWISTSYFLIINHTIRTSQNPNYITIKLHLHHSSNSSHIKALVLSYHYCSPVHQMSAAMALPISLVLLSSLFTVSLSSRASHKPSSHIAVMGVVYCDICSNNNFSSRSYFLPGAEVKVDCKFNALSPETAEQISFSVNRTTNKAGVYRLEIPSIDGIECAEESELASSCQATLLKSSSSLCNVPGYRTTSDVMTIKSKQANLCFYTFSALNFRPKKRDASSCGA